MPDLCNLCPRQCNTERGKGICGMGALPVVARASLHFWEEPCISGKNGSGTVFFSGCSLSCLYCQNYPISHGRVGKEVAVGRLRDIYRELCAQGAHNINLVNPTHFVPAVLESLDPPPPVPVVYNSGGYDRVDSLRALEGKIQIYLPDYKYALSEPAGLYSAAPDYPETARKAIEEMYRQVGDYMLDEDGLMRSGLLIRHLILPGNLENFFRVIDRIKSTFAGCRIRVSLMSQYTPCGGAAASPPLDRAVTRREALRVQEYLYASGLTDGYVQEPGASEEYIPPFNLEGV